MPLASVIKPLLWLNKDSCYNIILVVIIIVLLLCFYNIVLINVTLISILEKNLT